MSLKLRVFKSIVIAAAQATGADEAAVLPPVVEQALDDLAAARQPAFDETA